MSSFDLLSPTIRKIIWDLGWDSLTPVQDAAIPKIINSNNHVLISSGTASGKTEAAFLPILSLLEEFRDEEGIQVLYISPLKALINNQFERLDYLLKEYNMDVHSWHGDVSGHKKKALLKKPNGILQITPESIESLFINRQEFLPNLFKNLKFIVVDEIHSFLGTERGIHLQSLIYRASTYSKNNPRIIGLSATVEDYERTFKWISSDKPTELVAVGHSDKELLYNLMYFEADEEGKIPNDLYEDIYELTKNMKTIIFCNSRGAVEETTFLLNKLSKKEFNKDIYFAHHSSIDKNEREYVEENIVNSSEPMSIVATSSLELGIDIGDIELVVQIDSTHNVSSLKQRLGRSGRKKEHHQMLQLYSTNKDSLLQTIAVMELAKENVIRDRDDYKFPFDIMYHQIMSFICEKNGCNIDEIIDFCSHNPAFSFATQEEVLDLLEFMFELGHLEMLGDNSIIFTLEGERVVRSRDFYAVFSTQETFDVYYLNSKIGQFDKKFDIDVGDQVILNGSLWRIKEIDDNRNIIFVERTHSAKKPIFYSDPVVIDETVTQKMFEILISNDFYDYLDSQAMNTLYEMRQPYIDGGLKPNERPIWQGKDLTDIDLFSSSKITYTLTTMLTYLDVPMTKPDKYGRFTTQTAIHSVEDLLYLFNSVPWKNEDLLDTIQPTKLFRSKYSPYIPPELRDSMHIENLFDLKGAKEFLEKIKFVELSYDDE